MKTFLQRCDETADTFVEEWMSLDPDRRRKAVQVLVRNKAKRTEVAIIALRIADISRGEAHKLVGALSFMEELRGGNKRKGKE